MNECLRLPAVPSRLVAGMAALGIALGASPVEASTGGTAPSAGAAPVTHTPNPAAPKATSPAELSLGACPTATEMAGSHTISGSCRQFLMQTLRSSVFDDVTDSFAVGTYQKFAFPKQADGSPSKEVDGSLGPKTAAKILKGTALHIASPEPGAKHKLYVRKSDQVVYWLNKTGAVEHVFSIATGTEQPYDETAKDGSRHIGTAHTPTGDFKIIRTRGKNETGPLGPMPFAHYLNYYVKNPVTGKKEEAGLALHADPISLGGRLSHMCVRLEYATAAKYLQPVKNGTAVKIVE